MKLTYFIKYIVQLYLNVCFEYFIKILYTI